jgi:hypothetical protein
MRKRLKFAAGVGVVLAVIDPAAPLRAAHCCIACAFGSSQV